MSSIKQIRIDYLLDKKFDCNGIIQTRREWLYAQANIGTRAKIGKATPKFNRNKYNKLGSNDQQAYYDKAQKVSLEFQLWYSDKSYYVITKTEYEYYLSLGKGTTAIKFDLYQEVMNISGVVEIIEKLENEQDDDLWWTIAETLLPLLSTNQLKIIDDQHGWSLSD